MPVTRPCLKKEQPRKGKKPLNRTFEVCADTEKTSTKSNKKTEAREKEREKLFCK